MIKLFLMLIIAGLVYVGLNWDQFSAQLRSGIDTVDEVKGQAEDTLSDAKDKLDQARDKVEHTKDTMNDLLDDAK